MLPRNACHRIASKQRDQRIHIAFDYTIEMHVKRQLSPHAPATPPTGTAKTTRNSKPYSSMRSKNNVSRKSKHKETQAQNVAQQIKLPQAKVRVSRRPQLKQQSVLLTPRPNAKVFQKPQHSTTP